MQIKLKKTTYNLDNSKDETNICNYIKKLNKDDNIEILNNITQQIESATIVKKHTINVYNKAKKIIAEIEEFPMSYCSRTKDENILNASYTYVNKKFYRLPANCNDEDIVYALIDKYIYERKRNDRNSEVCLQLRRAIDKFMPGTINSKESDLAEILHTKETESRTYYADYLSEDSDSDAEIAYNQLPEQSKNKKTQNATSYRKSANYVLYQKYMDGEHNPPNVDIKQRTSINRTESFNRRNAQADLNKINEILEHTGTLSTEFLQSLDTKFVIAQYRGIHYTTDKWNKDSRSRHRKLNEINQPQYSSAVFEHCGIKSYSQHLDALAQDEEYTKRLNTAAGEIAKKLIAMQHSQPISYGGYAYCSLFHLLQYWYSSDYPKFSKRIEDDLKKESSKFKDYLYNSSRPLLSTGDIPCHALKYAYGIKLYNNYKDMRLRPRWRANAKAERPYSGKVYVSIHPLEDYTKLNPSHVTSMYHFGLLKLMNLISSERETSFLAYLPEERIIMQHIAKYPSFDGAYKNIYEHKYGISEPMYKKLQQGFNDFAPHSEKRKNLIHVLGEYLCAYQEVRLIDIANHSAKQQGAVLIYRDENGKFSLYLPETPHTAIKRTNSIVMAKRKLYGQLARDKTHKITTLTAEYIKEKLDNISTQPQISHEMHRFFTSKNDNYNIESNTPPLILVK